MAPPSGAAKRRTGKKGKKAWRSIDTSDVVESIAEQSRQERLGQSFEGIPDADLFFFDKGEDEPPQPPQPAPTLSKRESVRAKPLRHEAILAMAHTAKPVTAPPQKPKAVGAGAVTRGAGKPPAQTSSLVVTRARRQQPKKGAGTATYDLWDAPQPSNGIEDMRLSLDLVPKAGRTKTRNAVLTKTRLIRGVEVDGQGSSFNPDPKLHEEAIVQAAAEELAKEAKVKRLQAAAPGRWGTADGTVDELARLQVPEEVSDGEDAPATEDTDALRKVARPRKKTQTDRNKERRKRANAALQARAKRHKLRQREWNKLPAITAELDAEESERRHRHQARLQLLEKRSRQQPAQIGTGKYRPLPLQVLTTSEATGSLRDIKPMAMLTEERFNSLQKRGLLPVQKPVAKKKAAKLITYIRGEKGEREREEHAGVVALKKKYNI